MKNKALALRAAKGVSLSSVAIFTVTTIHHIYGAHIYNTPWRVHAAVVSGLATALIAVCAHVLRRHLNDVFSTVVSWVFIAVSFLVPFLGFGVFEGVYNHALKVALYLAHASPELMTRLFPPPTYEMPNDVFFEITGVLQVIPRFITGYYLYQFVGSLQNSHDAGSDTLTSAT